jgi:uncharacterized protein YbbC (DUF1343 family)
MTLFGIDRLLADPELRRPLEGRRVASSPSGLRHADLTHSIDALIAAGLNVTAAFGPQHGLKGDKQDNMVETADETDPRLGIPVFSLYGEVRRPTGQMMSAADVFLFDLQDLGCRIYTFVTTCSTCSKPRRSMARKCGCSTAPTPPGRPVEGTCSSPAGKASSARADADAPRPDHGRDGPLVHRHFKLDVAYRVIEMEGWSPTRPRASAGRPTGSGSTPVAQCRQPSTWRGPMPAPSCWKARR